MYSSFLLSMLISTADAKPSKKHGNESADKSGSGKTSRRLPVVRTCCPLREIDVKYSPQENANNQDHIY